ncbi:hypothetical protein [Pontibacillus yanchengensis]|uniref:Uncharacterized protein n=1 Tax=Pontibacillus yanchengensis Y32 TaxID=1385514 RepID=A0A0A2TUA3_9BACI|nr:hypothetical protein [Pontibacillus yanchengensis]KGP72820.1 hypothetical protein N782_10115 [Pontibacillus yanchengensis Y32]
MVDLEDMRNRIKSLNESDAKSLAMLTYANLQMVKTGNGRFTSEECVDQLLKLFTSIPEHPETNRDD